MKSVRPSPPIVLTGWKIPKLFPTLSPLFRFKTKPSSRDIITEDAKKSLQVVGMNLD